MAEEQQLKRFGDPSGLLFELSWLKESHASRLAWGEFTVRVRGQAIWHGEGGRGLEWSWIELLEHLARSWRFIQYEERFPGDLSPTEPIQLSDGQWLTRQFGAKGAIPDSELYVFQRRHDLATGIEGAYLPSLWIVRRGRMCWVSCERETIVTPMDFVLETLRQVGEAIAAVVGSHDDARSGAAVASWSSRETGSDRSRLAIAAGVSETLLFELTDGAEPTEYCEYVEGTDSEYAAAARMSAGVSIEVRREILGLIKHTPLGTTEALDQLTEDAHDIVAAAGFARFEQGQALARWFRRRWNLDSARPASPQQLLAELGVHVEDVDLGVREIEALAVWSGRRGPAVFVNRSGRHSQSVGGRNATLAHELCHLLVDRAHSLPVAEVLGGRAPEGPEQRANAFAAELLIPQDAAARELTYAQDRKAALYHLVETYGASRQVVGWQVYNGAGWGVLDESARRLVRDWTRPLRNAQTTRHR
ncbi:MAG: hypothetical protein CO108_21990 [Deltaproteobacteria bacterium CG_4_9_14_3_um_filter_63_12]|nr:MAG: hypothetical protein CO108_21990 [Deltaproteobacteria bacterium CG_4_9_14_3_um_filter_63_12]